MREVSVSNGKYIAVVDDADYDLVIQRKWYYLKLVNGRVYARCNVARGRQMYMHTLITGFKLVDHINGDGLDNRRENLRESSPTLNQGNVKSWSNNTSGYRGVRMTSSGMWMARLNTKTKHIYLGSFPNIEDAAMAYDRAALEYFGEHARLNFPGSERQ